MSSTNKHSSEDRKQTALPLFVRVPLVVIFVLFLLPLIPLLLAAYFVYGFLLQLVIWISWCTRGVNVLLVYSNSPNWQEYIETNILPRLPPSTVAINWSDRRNWKRFSVPVMAFRFFGGSREFNPLVVVFQPLRWARTYRFWKPLKEDKHGKAAPLRTLEAKLFDDLSRAGIGTMK